MSPRDTLARMCRGPSLGRPWRVRNPIHDPPVAAPELRTLSHSELTPQIVVKIGKPSERPVGSCGGRLPGLGETPLVRAFSRWSIPKQAAAACRGGSKRGRSQRRTTGILAIGSNRYLSGPEFCRVGETYMSARGGYGQYLRRKLAQTGAEGRLSVEHTGHIIQQILENLRVGGLVDRVVEPHGDDDVPGYQVVAAAMRWKAGDGTRSFHDPIRVPNQPVGGGRTNPFFVDFYQTTGNQLIGFEAREHTAQVPYENREEREARFRTGNLPILFCSPTMELGVDIAQLNVVNMRNIPPTPANYAQRSGRAGRSGQPALVFSYCTTGSSHDQYFFKRPKRMVSGAVAPPRIDLANEDLIRSHVQAIWLAETGLKLGASLKDILDLSGEQLVLPLLPHVKHGLEDETPRARAKKRAEKILGTIQSGLDASDWCSQGWLDEVFRRLSAASVCA